MKKLAVILLVIPVISFTGISETGFSSKTIKHNYAKIKEDLYVSKYEVSNADYRNFLADLAKNNQQETYNKNLPDTACWRSAAMYNEPFVQYYFRYPSYDNYPVVGITYEMANDYCNWLSMQYNQDKKRNFKKVQFRLLSKAEWTFAANKGDTSKVYTWGSGYIQNNRKQYLCNFKHTRFEYDSLTKKYVEFPDSENAASTDKATITAPTNSYFPNSFGIYNMCGNVAEMIAEKGIAKGGSFIDPAYLVRIASEKSYDKPQADIGFRVAMQVIEK